MVAARIDLTAAKVIEQGATWSLVFVCEDANGNPINIDGWDARSQFRTAYGGEIVVEPTCVVTNGAQGQITVSLKATSTANMAPSGQAASGVYDLEVYSGIQVIRVAKGTWTLDPEVTTSAASGSA